VASTRSIRSELSANVVPESRVSVIMRTVLGQMFERPSVAAREMESADLVWT
jgi:hypothetical protein